MRCWGGDRRSPVRPAVDPGRPGDTGADATRLDCPGCRPAARGCHHALPREGREQASAVRARGAPVARFGDVRLPRIEPCAPACRSSCHRRGRRDRCRWLLRLACKVRWCRHQRRAIDCRPPVRRGWRLGAELFRRGNRGRTHHGAGENSRIARCLTECRLLDSEVGAQCAGRGKDAACHHRARRQRRSRRTAYPDHGATHERRRWIEPVVQHVRAGWRRRLHRAG